MTPEFEAKVRDLLDRQEILDCLHRYSRGIDRFDREMVLSAYHPDAVDDHGLFVGGREAFVDWAMALHQEHQISHHHMVLNHTVELQGDTAHSEIYWLFFSENRVKPNTLSYGRYLDRFERRDGRWAIAARVCLIESTNDIMPTETTPAMHALATSNGPSTRDRTDRSWERPLQGRQP